MRIILSLFLSIFLIQGCATVKQPVNIKEQKASIIKGKEGVVSPVIPEGPSKEGVVEAKDSIGLQNIEDKKIEEYAEQNGIIFGKTDFQGVLKSRFVMVTIDNIDKPKRNYKLYIGENKEDQTFPWDFKPVEPGYFFIELPGGKYKISSISIPVGSTIATENTNVYFEVQPNSIVYGGTLKMNGIKEKIKLGGVPLIKPGFEYTTEIVDNREEGLKVFHSRFPEFSGEVVVDLFKNNIN